MFPLIYHTSSLFPWEFLEKKSRMIIFCLGMYDFWQDFDFFWSCTPVRYTCQSQRLSANLLNWKYIIANELGKYVSPISQITHVLFSSKLKSNKQNNIMRRFYLYWYQRQRFYLFQDIFSVELLHWVFLLLYKSKGVFSKLQSYHGLSGGQKKKKTTTKCRSSNWSLHSKWWNFLHTCIFIGKAIYDLLLNILTVLKK